MRAALLLALLCAGCGHSGGKDAGTTDKSAPPLPAVQTALVQRRTLSQTLPVSGTLKASQSREATIMPLVAGVLDQLPVRYGQQVQQGQLVAHLATATLAGGRQQAQATLGQAEVQVQQAQAAAAQQRAQSRTGIAQAQAAVLAADAATKREQATLAGNDAALLNARQSLARQQTLYKDGLVPLKDVEAAQLTVRTAQAQVAAQQQTVDAQRQAAAGQRVAVQAAQAAALQDVVKQKDVQVARRQVQNARGALATAQAQSALYTLRAPLSGQVTFVGATVGTSVDTATKIATIADLRTLVLTLGVPADMARTVHSGQTVLFSVPGQEGRTRQATLYNVSTQVDAATGTVPALALVPNPDGRLRDDATVKARIVTESRPQALCVPPSALLTDPDTGATTVVTIGADSVAHVTPVKTGLTADGLVQITSGLQAGQRVAVSGQYALPDKTKVAASPAAKTSGTEGAHGP